MYKMFFCLDKKYGMAHTGDFISGKTCQINGWVPCIPTPDGRSWWGYTSAPKDKCEWWESLPLY